LIQPFHVSLNALKLINGNNIVSVLVTADFRDPLPKGGEGVGGETVMNPRVKSTNKPKVL